MKKNILFSKFACGVMIALIVPLSTVSAADVNDHIQAQIGGDGVMQAHEASSGSMSQGPQGPIRTDFMADQAALGNSYGFGEDAPADRFAYPEDAPALSATSRGADGP